MVARVTAMKHLLNIASDNSSFSILSAKNLVEGTSDNPKKARKHIFPDSSSPSTGILPAGIEKVSSTIFGSREIETPFSMICPPSQEALSAGH
jgi:hypothetical protein